MIKKVAASFLLFSFISLSFCNFVSAQDVLLESGTRVRLKLADNISTKFNTEGDEVNFIVSDEVKIDDTTVIKAGARATGIISELYSRANIGKPGELVITLDYVEAVNGKKIPIVGKITKKGENRIMTPVLFSVLLFPIGLCSMCVKGTDATVPAKYQITARVDRDINLEINDDL